ncbi:aromatic-ring-hydroxylating dioxygenase subunit beta [Paraburkholderia caledonica]
MATTSRKRYERLRTGFANSEQARSVTRRFVTNILVCEETDGTLSVDTNMIVFQGRRGQSEHFFVACREDRIRQFEVEWKVIERKGVF